MLNILTLKVTKQEIKDIPNCLVEYFLLVEATSPLAVIQDLISANALF